MSEKILGEKEIKHLWNKLQMKYGVEINQLALRSARDMIVFNQLSPETEAFQKNLLERIEKENPNMKKRESDKLKVDQGFNESQKDSS
jgi:hypothetical protein